MFEYILNGISLLLSTKQYLEEKRSKKSAVISALNLALRLTKKHIHDTRTELYGDLESIELAEKWSNAAALIRPFNPDLANTLEMKSDYWTNPSGFRSELKNGDRGMDYRMKLDKIENIIKEINGDENSL